MSQERDFKNFRVHIDPLDDDRYSADVKESPVGTKEGPFEPPYGESDATRRLDALEKGLGQHILSQGADARELGRAQEELGRDLYTALMAGPVESVFERSLTNVETLAPDAPSLGLRLLIGFDPHQKISHVARLPWELLFKPDTRDFLGRSLAVRVVRYLESGRLIPELRVEGDLRVLLVDSAPRGLRPLKTDAEIERITRALKLNPRVEVTVRRQISLKALRTLLRDEEFHVLHFIGHGGFDKRAGEGAVALVRGEGDDRVQWVAAGTLGEFLKDTRSLRLVVLSTCYGATLPRERGQESFNGVAPALLTAGIPAVVAMQFPISDAAAIAFAETFYERLAKHDPVDVAVTEARLAIYGTPECSREWATPALFLRALDGYILGPPRVEAEPRAGEAEIERYHLGIWTGINSDGKVWGDVKGTSEKVLDLEGFFDEPSGRRRIRDPALWQTAVLPQLRDFLHGATSDSRPLLLDLVAQASIAFAAGYFLEDKSGLDVTVRQRIKGQPRPLDWSAGDSLAAEAGEDLSPAGPLWRQEEDLPGLAPPVAGGGKIRSFLRTLAWGQADASAARDVALAISISQPVTDDVQEFLQKNGIPVSRIIPLTIAPEPGGRAVRNGAHALQLAQSIARRIDSRTLPEKRGVLHIFAAAPNAVLFFLGQKAGNFRKVVLYEFAFRGGELGAYSPSVALPPNLEGV